MKKTARQILLRYASEAVVIFLSITASFLWESERIEKEGEVLMVEGLQALRIDLLHNQDRLSRYIPMHNKAAEAFSSLHSHLKHLETEVTDEEIRLAFEDTVLASQAFHPMSGSWDSFVSTGSLKWVESPRLRSALGHFYGESLDRLRSANSFLDTNMLHGYVAKVVHDLHWESLFVMDVSDRKLHGKVTREVLVGQKDVMALVDQATPQAWIYYRLLGEVSEHLERALREIDKELENLGIPIEA